MIENLFNDVNLPNQDGDTALHIACLNGDTEVVATLLANGANVHLRGLNNDMPIHIATENGHVEVLELLLAHNNIDREAINENGHTALNIASCNGTISIIACLLKNNVNVALKDLDPEIGCNDQKIIDILSTIINIEAAQDQEAIHAIIEQIESTTLLSIINIRLPGCTAYFSDAQRELLNNNNESDSEGDDDFLDGNNESDSEDDYDDDSLDGSNESDNGDYIPPIAGDDGMDIIAIADLYLN